MPLHASLGRLGRRWEWLFTHFTGEETEAQKANMRPKLERWHRGAGTRSHQPHLGCSPPSRLDGGGETTQILQSPGRQNLTPPIIRGCFLFSQKEIPVLPTQAHPHLTGLNCRGERGANAPRGAFKPPPTGHPRWGLLICACVSGVSPSGVLRKGFSSPPQVSGAPGWEQ